MDRKRIFLTFGFLLFSSILFAQNSSITLASLKKDFVTVIPTGQTINVSEISTDSSESELSSFSISKFETTQDLYLSVMGKNPSYHTDDTPINEKQMKRPVECVSIYDAILFCNELTKKTMGEENCCYIIKIIESTYNGRTRKNIIRAEVSWDKTKKGFRLPTREEWRYAAKGGNQNADDWNYIYSGSNNVLEVGWIDENSNDTTHEVGLLKPNALGLYDMTGNVLEMCYYFDKEGSAVYIGAEGGSFTWDQTMSEILFTYKKPSFKTGTEPKYSKGFRIAVSDCFN